MGPKHDERPVHTIEKGSLTERGRIGVRNIRARRSVNGKHNKSSAVRRKIPLYVDIRQPSSTSGLYEQTNRRAHFHRIERSNQTVMIVTKMGRRSKFKNEMTNTDDIFGIYVYMVIESLINAVRGEVPCISLSHPNYTLTTRTSRTVS